MTGARWLPDKVTLSTGNTTERCNVMAYYFEGYDGFAVRSICPYRIGTFARKLWLEGWEAATRAYYDCEVASLRVGTLSH